MARTSNLQLPLIQPSQAQKHVTVNEALGMLDGLAQLTLASTTVTAPPMVSPEGSAYAVPAGATGVWATEAGKVAIAANGGWTFVVPRAGWRGWVVDTGRAAIHDGTQWIEHGVAVASSGAASLIEVREIDVTLTPGPSVTTANLIPAPSLVLGVSGLVTQSVTGSLSAWRLGVTGGPGRYGTGIGVSIGSTVLGMSGQPQAYYAATPLVLEAENGTFAGGQVRLAVHLFRMTVPRP